MRRFLAIAILTLALTLSACPRTADAAPAAPAMLLTLTPIVNPTPAADTVQVDVAWDAFADDGRGPLDSVMVQVSNLTSSGGWLRSVLTPDMVGWSVRQAIPFTTATWEIPAQVCFYRRTKVSCSNATAQFNVEDVAPAAPGNVRLTVTVRPSGDSHES